MSIMRSMSISFHGCMSSQVHSKSKSEDGLGVTVVTLSLNLGIGLSKEPDIRILIRLCLSLTLCPLHLLLNPVAISVMPRHCSQGPTYSLIFSVMFTILSVG